MSVDREFRVRIVTTSETAGAQRTVAALDKVTAATEKVADESERYQRVLKQMAEAQDGAAMEAEMMSRAAERRATVVAKEAAATAEAQMDHAEAAGYAAGADQDLAQAVKTLTAEDVRNIETTTRATGAKKRLAGMLQQLGREFPLLGSAARAVMNPVIGLASAAVLIFAKLRSDLQKFHDSLTTSEWESYAAVTEEGRRALEAARLETAKYADDMNRLATAQDTASQAADRFMQAQRAQMSAEERLDEARKRVELARAGGEQDPVRRTEKVIEIEERYAARKLQREEQAAQFERNETYRKLANEEISAQMAGANLTKAKERLAVLGSEATLTERIRIEKGRLAATEAELTEKTALFDQSKGRFPFRSKLAREQYGRMVESLTSIRDRQRARVTALEASAPDQIAAIRSAQGDVTQWGDAQKGAINRAEEIRRGLPTQESVWSAEGRARRGVAGLASLERTYDAANEGANREVQLAQQIHQSITQQSSMVQVMIDALARQQAFNAKVEVELKRKGAQLKGSL